MSYPIPTHIYHITPIENLPKILQAQGLLAKSQLSVDSDYVSIAYQHIQERRAPKQVTIAGGGVLWDYVPFYFCNRSPMLGAIHKQLTTYKRGQTPILHIVSTVQRVVKANLAFAFTDRSAARIDYVEFFDVLSDLERLRWDYIRSHYWKSDQEHPDRKECKQAEFLVHKSLPWDLVSGIGVMNSTIQTEVLDIMTAFPKALQRPVEIRGTWYY